MWGATLESLCVLCGKVFDFLFRFQALLQQFGRQFVQASFAFMRQCMKLFYQFAVQLDRERDQAESLIAFALLAPIHHDGRALAEATWSRRPVHQAVDFLAFAFFEVGFFQGLELKCEGSG